MRKVFQAGIVIVIFGTLIDLAYHAVTEPEEILPDDMPVELLDHIIIMVGLGILIVGGIVAALRGED